MIPAWLKGALVHPLARGLDPESPDSVRVHREIVAGKPLLRACYDRWYRECLPAYEAVKEMPGGLLEVGCGAGHLERFIPGLVRTDVAPNPFADRVMDAEAMDLPDSSQKGLFLISVLHHLNRPQRFFSEAERVLRPGGRLVLVEPNNTLLERLLPSVMGHYEFFDDTVPDWDAASSGRMLNANLALPWVIFVRDRARFEKDYPRLRVLALRYHTFIAYYVSGGMSFRSFLPSFAAPAVAAAEWLAGPWMRLLGSMMTVELARD